MKTLHFPLLSFVCISSLFFIGCDSGSPSAAEGSNARSTDSDGIHSGGSRGLNSHSENVEIGKRVAMVIGVDSYDHLDKDGQLNVAVVDVRQMRDTLTSFESPFAVTLLENATPDEIEDALNQFIDNARDAKCALVYFAGHGFEYHSKTVGQLTMSPKTIISDCRAHGE